MIFIIQKMKKLNLNKKIKVNFWTDSKATKIECSLDSKMLDISISFSNKIRKEYDSLDFSYGGEKININQTINQIIDDNDLIRGEMNINVEEKNFEENEIPIEKDAPKKN